MEYKEAKEQFISTWGELGCNWGICRTMGHIHALLLINPASLSAEAVPPVESSSTPNSWRPFAKSTNPVLSDTESSARLIAIMIV